MLFLAHSVPAVLCMLIANSNYSVILWHVVKGVLELVCGLSATLLGSVTDGVE